MNTAIARVVNAGTVPLVITPFIDGDSQPTTTIDPSKSTDLVVAESDLERVFWIAGHHAVKSLGNVAPFPESDPLPDTAPQDLEAVAQRLWDVYAEAAGGTTFDGKPLPAWADLGAKGHANWKAVAAYVLAPLRPVDIAHIRSWVNTW
jgi:hypothetical protein